MMSLEELVSRIARCHFPGIKFTDIDWWSIMPKSVTIKTDGGEFVFIVESDGVTVRQYQDSKAVETGMAQAYKKQLLAVEV